LFFFLKKRPGFRQAFFHLDCCVGRSLLRRCV